METRGWLSLPMPSVVFASRLSIWMMTRGGGRCFVRCSGIGRRCAGESSFLSLSLSLSSLSIYLSPSASMARHCRAVGEVGGRDGGCLNLMGGCCRGGSSRRGSRGGGVKTVVRRGNVSVLAVEEAVSAVAFHLPPLGLRFRSRTPFGFTQALASEGVP